MYNIASISAKRISIRPTSSAHSVASVAAFVEYRPYDVMWCCVTDYIRLD